METKPRGYEKHGGTHTRSYRIWWDMIQRCTNQNHAHYDRYGGRGINVCNQWIDSFGQFFKDMGEIPPKMTIERKNNNLGYSKENCRWASRYEQSINRQGNVPMTVGGVTKSISEWVKERGLSYDLVYYRKQIAGWSDGDCLSPKKRKQPVTLVHDGRKYTIAEIAEKVGTSITSVHLRIKAGWTVEEIVNRPNSQVYKKPGWKFER